MAADVRPGNQGRRHPVKHQQEECQMAYLDLSPAIAALRAQPEEFEFSNDTLHHLGSGHRFRFPSEDSVEIHADCGCALLKASQEQTKLFHTAYCEWHASYWRPLEINREFASHFEPTLWRRVAIWLLRRLLATPRMKTVIGRTDLAYLMVHYH
jgi:hypothetical protein